MLKEWGVWSVLVEVGRSRWAWEGGREETDGREGKEERGELERK